MASIGRLLSEGGLRESIVARDQKAVKYTSRSDADVAACLHAEAANGTKWDRKTRGRCRRTRPSLVLTHLDATARREWHHFRRDEDRHGGRQMSEGGGGAAAPPLFDAALSAFLPVAKSSRAEASDGKPPVVDSGVFAHLWRCTEPELQAALLWSTLLQPTEPTELTEPTEPTVPTEPTELTKPTKPTELTKPVQAGARAAGDEGLGAFMLRAGLRKVTGSSKVHRPAAAFVLYDADLDGKLNKREWAEAWVSLSAPAFPANATTLEPQSCDESHTFLTSALAAGVEALPPQMMPLMVAAAANGTLSSLPSTPGFWGTAVTAGLPSGAINGSHNARTRRPRHPRGFDEAMALDAAEVVALHNGSVARMARPLAPAGAHGHCLLSFLGVSSPRPFRVHADGLAHGDDDDGGRREGGGALFTTAALRTPRLRADERLCLAKEAALNNANAEEQCRKQTSARLVVGPTYPPRPSFSAPPCSPDYSLLVGDKLCLCSLAR